MRTCWAPFPFHEHRSPSETFGVGRIRKCLIFYSSLLSSAAAYTQGLMNMQGGVFNIRVLKNTPYKNKTRNALFINNVLYDQTRTAKWFQIRDNDTRNDKAPHIARSSAYTFRSIRKRYPASRTHSPSPQVLCPVWFGWRWSEAY